MTDERSQWTEPGAYEVVPGIYRIPLPLPNDGLRAVNVYAITGGEHLVLIDGGWSLEESQRQLADSLDSIGYGLADISEFLVTHIHRDHYTQAVAIRRTFGARVSLGAGEQPSLERIRDPERVFEQLDLLRRGGAMELYHLLASVGAPGPEQTKDYEPPDVWLPESVLELGGRTLQAIATPGHTQGHLVYRDADAGVLFGGDHVLPHITPSIGLESVQGRLPLQDYLLSLELMHTMPDVLLLPAHGPVAPSVHDRVDELIEHHRVRLDDTLAAVSGGASTAFEVANQLGWTRRHKKFTELDPFNATLAVMETLAHLDVLVARHRMTSTDIDEVRHYSI